MIKFTPAPRRWCTRRTSPPVRRAARSRARRRSRRRRRAARRQQQDGGGGGNVPHLLATAARAARCRSFQTRRQMHHDRDGDGPRVAHHERRSRWRRASLPPPAPGARQVLQPAPARVRLDDGLRGAPFSISTRASPRRGAAPGIAPLSPIEHACRAPRRAKSPVSVATTTANGILSIRNSEDAGASAQFARLRPTAAWSSPARVRLGAEPAGDALLRRPEVVRGGRKVEAHPALDVGRPVRTRRCSLLRVLPPTTGRCSSSSAAAAAAAVTVAPARGVGGSADDESAAGAWCRAVSRAASALARASRAWKRREAAFAARRAARILSLAERRAVRSWSGAPRDGGRRRAGRSAAAGGGGGASPRNQPALQALDLGQRRRPGDGGRPPSRAVANGAARRGLRAIVDLSGSNGAEAIALRTPSSSPGALAKRH